MKRDHYRTFTYPSDYDENACEEFIKHFVNLGIYIAIDCLKRSNQYFGMDLCKSAAYEGCFKAFLLSSKIENPDYKHKKGLVRMCVKRAFWSLAIVFGYIRSSGQSYFPSVWVDYNNFFKDRSAPDNFSDNVDIHIVNEIIKTFPNKEYEIHQLFLSGYDYAEIGRILGYKNKSSALKMHKRTLYRVKEKLCH